MTAYDRTTAAMYGIEFGAELERVRIAVAELARAPGESEIEESISARADSIVRALRKALRAAEMLRHICGDEDRRPPKRL